MRIAVLTDVHGNRFALEAVLDDIRSASPDVIANLGDQVLGFADPAGAYAILRGLGSVNVRGNCDELYAARLEELEEARADVEELRTLLPVESVEALGSLPLTATLADGEVLLCHGSPSTPWVGLLAVREGHSWRDATREELRERLAEHASARVVVVGHTHTEHLRLLGSTTLVNSGPVAYQNDGNPAARWTLLERRRGGWSVTFRRVAYDVETAARWIEERHPDKARDAAHLRDGRFS